MDFQNLNKTRINKAKQSFNTRNIPTSKMAKLVSGKEIKPHTGDLVLAKVKKIGQHTRIQNTNGRRSRLYVGDELILCYGNRYAVHQFEALVPKTLTQCELVAAGGIASEVQSKHSGMKSATKIQPIGLIADSHNSIININKYSLIDNTNPDTADPIVIGVVGAEMNSGKTTTAASIVHSGVNLGLTVAAIKATGTGACGDYFELLDAGACCVFDIVDAGHISTFKLEKKELIRSFNLLVNNCKAFSPELIVVELGDGILQEETNYLLSSDEFKAIINSIVIASNESVGAIMMSTILKKENLPVTAICGVAASSHLGRESIMNATGIPSYSLEELRRSQSIYDLLPKLQTPIKELG